MNGIGRPAVLGLVLSASLLVDAARTASTAATRGPASARAPR